MARVKLVGSTETAEAAEIVLAGNCEVMNCADALSSSADEGDFIDAFEHELILKQDFSADALAILIKLGRRDLGIEHRDVTVGTNTAGCGVG